MNGPMDSIHILQSKNLRIYRKFGKLVIYILCLGVVYFANEILVRIQGNVRCRLLKLLSEIAMKCWSAKADNAQRGVVSLYLSKSVNEEMKNQLDPT